MRVGPLARGKVRQVAVQQLLDGSAVLIGALSFLMHSAIATAQLNTPVSELPVATVHVDATPDHVINSFDPDAALGSSIDVLSRTGIDKVYTPHIIQESLSAGWGPITYRNNTELRMAAWHWTENGTWSDAAHRSGYFTGSTNGKHAMPEDYGALYLQWAAAIHKIDPKLRLGGPVFEGVNEDIRAWPDARGRVSWMSRFVDYPTRIILLSARRSSQGHRQHSPSLRP